MNVEGSVPQRDHFSFERVLFQNASSLVVKKKIAFSWKSWYYPVLFAPQ
jgi:hypothetical protein